MRIPQGHPKPSVPMPRQLLNLLARIATKRAGGYVPAAPQLGSPEDSGWPNFPRTDLWGATRVPASICSTAGATKQGFLRPPKTLTSLPKPELFIYFILSNTHLCSIYFKF